jgi:hypothetical protein
MSILVPFQVIEQKYLKIAHKLEASMKEVAAMGYVQTLFLYLFSCG